MARIRSHRSSIGSQLHVVRRRGATRISVAILIGVTILALVGGVAWFVFSPQGGWTWRKGDQPNGLTQKIDAVRAAELLRTARVANAYLEDEDEDVGVDADGNKLIGYLEAEKRFVELHAELPHELLPLVNLAISRILYLQKNEETMGEEEKANWVEKIRQNVQDLKQQTPQSAIPCLLAAHFLETLSRDSADQRVLEELRQARKLAPDFLNAHWLFYEKARNAEPTADLTEELAGAVNDIYRLAPHNIDFLKDYFLLLAERQDGKLVELLENSRDLITTIGVMKASENPQAGMPAENTFEALLDEAIAGAKTNDWPKATQSIRLLGNLMRGMEVQRIDYGRLSLNLLDYMQHDFSDNFYARIEKNQAEAKSTSQPLAGLYSSKRRSIYQLPLNAFQAVDFDNDAALDIVGIGDGKLVVLSQSATNTAWSTLVEHDLPGDYDGLLCADLDRDTRATDDDTWKTNMQKLVANAKRLDDFKENPADPDVIVFGPAGLKVLLNDNGFKEVEQNSDVAALRNITSAVLIDIEADADLDLVLATEKGLKILLNPGNQRFVDFSFHSILPAESVEIGSLAIADWDRDVDVDVIVGNRAGDTIGVLENLLHGNFRWQPFGADYKEFRSGRALHVVEADGNVSWDLMGAGEQGFQLCLTETTKSQVSPQRTQSFGDQKYLGLTCADLDNDTYFDVIAWTGNQVQFFQGAAGGTFQISDFNLDGLEDVRKWSADDLDYDGDLDLIVSSAAGVQILENGSRKNNWITLLPIGIDESKGRANHNGIGSMVELIANGRYQAQTITSERIHFGLDGAEQADVLRILWTNGMPQNLIEPQSNLIIREVMFEKGSCPFIYVWNGTEFEFFSDCLWAAPIGLRDSDGNTVPTREWEYLKIPGDKLKASNGVYRIQLTEELWEAAYFDFVELIAVDHPTNVEIFTNEKVGPPSIAEHQIFAIAEKRLPVSARDNNGRDVLGEVAAEDGRYMQGFEKRLYKGVTPPHYLELDLGAWHNPHQIRLFLTGWIRPTDSSLNVGFSQNPQVDGPVAPQVWVPDADGQWQLRIAPMGFPGGKSKTIAVDLSNAFLTDDYRLRVQTSAEIYWDHVFFSVDEPSYPLQIHDLPVAAADLHFRGFSHRFFADEQSPEWYDYQRLSTTPRWPPLRGMFTRYGEVEELLTAPDDRLVVLGSGDEMTVAFRVPETVLPDGWQRDFILHSVGYDKDADLNTLQGQSSEPLPFRAMKSYPSQDREVLPATAEYEAYLHKYQTRQQSWSRFWNLLSGGSTQEVEAN